MRLLIFSDIHGDRAALERLMARDADHYFCAGDLVNFGRGLDDLAPILQRRADRLHVLPGNHESATDIAQFCGRHGFDDFHGKSIQIDGIHVAGLGYSNVTPFRTPGEYTEAELAEHLLPFAPLIPLILICHCPPKGTLLDRAGEGLHFGSPAVRNFLDQHQPLRFYCGHIHEAAGAVDRIGSTVGHNVGKAGVLLDLADLAGL